MLDSWLLNFVFDSIAQTIIFHENFIVVLNDLKKRFSKIDRVRVANSCFLLNNLKQGSKSFLKYFIEMKFIWDEIAANRPRVECLAGLTQEKYDQLMCLLQRANSIPSTGHNIGSNTNHLNTPTSSHTNHSSFEPHQSGIPSIIKSHFYF